MHASCMCTATRTQPSSQAYCCSSPLHVVCTPGAASRPSLLYLEGKALNVLSEPSVRAEEVLSQAVKLSPGLADAWNQLGECYWKQERVEEAKDCFLGALQHVRAGPEGGA